MKNLYLAMAFSLIAASCFAQLSGQVKDEKGSPLTYANVAVLLAKDSTGITGSITDEDGQFSIQAPSGGVYLLRLNAIGYVTAYSAPFNVSGPGFLKSFGTLVLKQDNKVLSEVTVKALRPTIIAEADKLVVSVEGTALASGSTAFEVLEKSPGVWVDQEGNIQLNGKAGVRVMLDGRNTYLSGKELQSLLDGMSAENIKSIEVITNPSTKYEAAGSSGIINIRLKQHTALGMNGSVYGGYQYNGADGYSAGLNLNYKKGNWNSFLNADMAQRPRLREGVMVREFHEGGADARFRQVRDENMTMRTPSLRLGTDYELNASKSIGVMLNVGFTQVDRAFYSGSELKDNRNHQHTFVKAGNFNDISNANKALNLHYNVLPDTTGTSIAVNLDLIRLNNLTDARYENQFTNLESNETSEELLKSHNPGYYQIFAAMVDVERNVLQKLKLETGIKASRVISGNELDFYVADAETEELDQSRSNHYRYTENILAVYTNIKAKLSENWSLQAGLRGEQTLGKGKPMNGGTSLSRRYFNLFPSFFLTQKVHDNYQITYNYSRRVDRPNYKTLNPFIFYQDPYSWAEGNPDLSPQYTHSFQVTQTLSHTYNLILGYALTNDYFAEVPEQNSEDNTTVYQERNIDKAQNFTATLVAPVKVLPYWDISNNLVADYQKNKILLQDKELENNQFNITAQVTNNVLLPWGLQLQATAAYSSASTFGIYRFEPQWWLDAGVKRAFLDDRLDVTLAGTDLFRTREIHGDASYNGNVFSFVNYFMVRSIKLNLRYNFQRGASFKSKRRNVNLEELNRAGGN